MRAAARRRRGNAAIQDPGHLVTATWKVVFEVYAGDRYVLLGPSGCGKSSLLKSIAGFLPPVSGSFRLAGRPIERPGSDRMMVFQEFDQLLPWKTVLGNVMFPLLVNRRMPRAGGQGSRPRAARQGQSRRVSKTSIRTCCPAA